MANLLSIIKICGNLTLDGLPPKLGFTSFSVKYNNMSVLHFEGA